MSSITLTNNLDNPTISNNIRVEARCSCGFNKKEFLADYTWAKENWTDANQTLMNMGCDWLKRIDCKCEQVEDLKYELDTLRAEAEKLIEVIDDLVDTLSEEGVIEPNYSVVEAKRSVANFRKKYPKEEGE